MLITSVININPDLDVGLADHEHFGQSVLGNGEQRLGLRDQKIAPCARGKIQQRLTAQRSYCLDRPLAVFDNLGSRPQLAKDLYSDLDIN